MPPFNQQDYMIDYYRDNKGKIKARSALWYHENKNKILKSKKRQYQKNSKEVLEYNRNWRKNNPDKVRLINRKKSLKRHGLTIEEYNNLSKRQHNKCAICSLPNRRLLVVDHDHKTKKVRGLLCDPCNVILGHAKEDKTILFKAIKYLEKHKEMA